VAYNVVIFGIVLAIERSNTGRSTFV